MRDSPATLSQEIKIGLAGLGNVGAGVYKNLQRNGDLLAERTGARFAVQKIAVHNLSKDRGFSVPDGILTTDWQDLIDDPDIDIIVELIGGVAEASRLVRAALKAKKMVITGNKALLAEEGHELVALAEKEDVPLYFEAAVAGGIPIIKVVREALVGNHIQSIYGIINGTSNYILTRMAEAELDYSVALKEAQELGYAEADPALDVNGGDAAHKAIILAWLSYGLWVKPEQVFVDGVENVRRADIEFARSLGYAIKLLGVIRLDKSNRVEVRVQPSLVPSDHILASVNGVFNAVAVRGDVVGETLYYGSGAGQDATSSAVISDLADAAANLENKAGCQGFAPHGFYGEAMPIAETVSAYYVRLQVRDVPGVIAQISRAIADHEIGISSVAQPKTHGDAELIDLMLVTHPANFGSMQAALTSIEALDCVGSQPVMMRVETLGA
ncbi:MAG: homoserine dehydrogenase [Verrucomicrobiales bacterium]